MFYYDMYIKYTIVRIATTIHLISDIFARVLGARSIWKSLKSIIIIVRVQACNSFTIFGPFHKQMCYRTLVTGHANTFSCFEYSWKLKEKKNKQPKRTAENYGLEHFYRACVAPIIAYTHRSRD